MVRLRGDADARSRSDDIEAVVAQIARIPTQSVSSPTARTSPTSKTS